MKIMKYISKGIDNIGNSITNIKNQILGMIITIIIKIIQLKINTENKQ